MADTKFMSFAEVVPLITDNVLVGNTGNGVRRASLANLKEVIGATPTGCGGIAEVSFNANGYVKFANGFTVQWGYSDVTNGGEYAFNIPFSDFYGMMIQEVAIDAAGVNNIAVDFRGNVSDPLSKYKVLISGDRTTTSIYYIAYGICV